MIGPVPTRDDLPVEAFKAKWTTPWVNWLAQVRLVCFDLQNAGTTALRPTTSLYTGKFYFDTTLGLPIYYKGPGWVKADGTAA